MQSAPKYSNYTNEFVTVAEVMNALSDNKAQALFKIIAVANLDNNKGDDLVNKIKVTRKEYYSRIQKLTKAGLVKRNSGKYVLTVLGEVIYHNLLAIESALNDHWKLKIVDSVKVSNVSSSISNEEYLKLVDTLIDNNQIKEIIFTDGNLAQKERQQQLMLCETCFWCASKVIIKDAIPDRCPSCKKETIVPLLVS